MMEVYQILKKNKNITNNCYRNYWFFNFSKIVNNNNMKNVRKIVLILFSFFVFNVNLLGYSEKVIVGGDNIGITLNSEGLIVVGFYKVGDRYIGKDTFKIGDVILKVEGISINSINDLSSLISENIRNNEVNLEVSRNNKIINLKLELVFDENVFKTGLYIKDKVTGIGTLTYIDPTTKIYGALGHEIILSDTGKRVEIKDGTIFSSYVNSIDRSVDGTIGSKNATILYNQILGNVFKNTEFGIYGNYKGHINNEVIDVGTFEEIQNGSAIIRTIINGDTIKDYKINITGKDKGKLYTTKSIVFEINDELLIENAGGIVQGMSGSPIIQNNKIIGAVTNVVVDDVKKGYGIFIRTMLEEGER